MGFFAKYRIPRFSPLFKGAVLPMRMWECENQDGETKSGADRGGRRTAAHPARRAAVDMARPGQMCIRDSLPSIFPLFPHFSANPRGKLSILYKKQFIFPQTGNIIIHMGEIQTDFLPISHRIGAITLAHPDRPDGAKGWAYQWKHRRFCRVSGGFILSASAARVCVRWPKSSMPWGKRSPVPMTWSRTTWPA